MHNVKLTVGENVMIASDVMIMGEGIVSLGQTSP